MMALRRFLIEGRLEEPGAVVGGKDQDGQLDGGSVPDRGGQTDRPASDEARP